MLAVGLLVLIPVLLWVGQSLLLLAAGRRLCWELSGEGLPAGLKSANRALLYLLLLAAIALYPMLRGERWADWLARLWPPAEAGDAAVGIVLALVFLLPLYAVWAGTDNVRWRIRHGWTALARRVAAAPLTALFAAAIEEMLFRGMLLDDLLRTFAPLPPAPPDSPATLPSHAAAGTPLAGAAAILLGATLFAIAHYVRRVKRYWTFPGHLALGLLFCTAYAATRNLWLSFGLHAAGILVIMGLRPMVRYTGPPWLVGASIFPYAGAPGIIALLTLSLLLAIRLG